MNFIVDKSELQSQDYLVVVKDQQLYVAESKIWQPFSLAEIDRNTQINHLCILVEKYQEKNCYVVELEGSYNPDDLISLRSQMSLLSDDDYLLASRALQLVTWYRQHRFCGQCGRRTEHHAVDRALSCQPCNLTYYPKISPCIMCLITRGEECLLAHHNRHPDGMYSTLAGFVEAGESLEQTLHREVLEEVGLTVNKLSYFSSQSWPFPHQLMMGYFAEYESGDIVVDNDEVLDARWFHYTDLPLVPPPETLSGQLINQFIQAQRSK